MAKHVTITFLLVLFLGSMTFGQATATLNQVYCIPGDSVEVDLNVTNFNGIGSFQFFFQIDPAVIQFDKVINFAGVGGILTNTLSGGSVVSMTWVNSSTPVTVLDGRFLTLKFHHIAGTGPIAFDLPNCEVAELATYTPIDVTYKDGYIGHNVRIGYATKTTAGSVDIPVTFDAFPTDSVNAIDLTILFDDTKLTCTGYTDNMSSGVVIGSSGNAIYASWSDLTPLNVNGTFITLHFTFTGSGGCDAAAVSIDKTTADIEKIVLGGPVPMVTNYYNGGVNVKYKISGTLLYDGQPNTDLPLIGYKVTLKTDPAETVVSSVITDANGHFELYSTNGNYKLIATAPTGKEWYGDLDDFSTLFDYVALGGPLPYENDIRLLAGDVNQNGSIDLDDATLVFYRVAYGYPDPEYIAPDFVFVVPAININCDDVNVIDFKGLCSGNVLGTNPAP